MDTITTGEQIMGELMGDGYLTEALNRGWGNRDSQPFLLLQQERAGVPPFAMTEQEVRSICHNTQSPPTTSAEEGR